MSVSGSHTTIATHKEFVLGALERVVAFEKGEPGKEVVDDGRHQLFHQIASNNVQKCA